MKKSGAHIISSTVSESNSDKNSKSLAELLKEVKAMEDEEMANLSDKYDDSPEVTDEDREKYGSMYTTVSQCFYCKNLMDVNDKEMKMTCKAFPDCIPGEIIAGLVDHQKPYHGDNGIVFEVAPGKEKSWKIQATPVAELQKEIDAEKAKYTKRFKM